MKSLPDLLFGPKHHFYQLDDEFSQNVRFSNVLSDVRRVDFVLKSIYRQRNKGPKRARRVEYVGSIVHWYVNEPLPIGNTKDDYKTVKAADFEVTGDYAHPLIWKAHAPGVLKGLIKAIRERNGFYWEDGEYYRANNI